MLWPSLSLLISAKHLYVIIDVLPLLVENYFRLYTVCMKTNPPREPAPRGRPNKGRKRFNLYIETELAEWAKQQPEGLSTLVRLLLAAERQRRGQD